jgi:hypothetical protein
MEDYRSTLEFSMSCHPAAKEGTFSKRERISRSEELLSVFCWNQTCQDEVPRRATGFGST